MGSHIIDRVKASRKDGPHTFTPTARPGSTHRPDKPTGATAPAPALNRGDHPTGAIAPAPATGRPDLPIGATGHARRK